MSSSNTLPSRQTSSSSSNTKTLIELIKELQKIVSRAQNVFSGGEKGGDKARTPEKDGKGAPEKDGENITAADSERTSDAFDKKDGEGVAAAATAVPAKAPADSKRTSGVVGKLSSICGKLPSAITKSTAQKEEEGDKCNKHDDSRSGSPVDSSTRLSPIDRLQINLDQVKAAVERLKGFEDEFCSKVKDNMETISQMLQNLPAAAKQTEQDSSSTSTSAAGDINIDETLRDVVDKKFIEINKEMMKLKHRIPSSSSLKLDSGRAAAHHDNSRKEGDGKTGSELDKLLSLHTSESFKYSSIYEEVQGVYNELEGKEKKCLLSFALFSENEELKKRMLTYLWAGDEEFLTADEGGEKKIEDVVGEILVRFVAKGLIEQVNKKRRTRAYRMEPVVRSAIVKVADESGEFSYDDSGNMAVKLTRGNNAVKKSSSRDSRGTETPSKEKAPDNSNQTSSSSSSRGSREPQTPSKEKAPDNSNQTSSSSSSSSIPVKEWDEEKLVMIFNVKEPYPDLRMKSLAKVKNIDTEEWLLKMKNLKVLCLGTWRASGKHHIEVDGTEFLKGLRNMSSLRLFSLQGISRINELTDSIKGLKDLRILDLKACHNLEELPKEISHLQNLTHLDVSDCFLIDHMPRGLSSLVNLQVLKGFVVGDFHQQTGKFCTLEHLAGMKKLRKLSIITSKKMFPTDGELKALENLPKLRKLTLSWGADPTQVKRTSTTGVNQPRSDQGVPLQQTKPNEGERVSLEKKKTFVRLKSQKTKPSTTTTGNDEIISSPWKLEKLDLQCYPHSTIPKWLTPKKLTKLDKLYIRGGNLGDDLGLSKGFEWKLVQRLRLKFLAGLKMDWEEMQRMFPKMSYLEKVDCPLITLCPCDEEGVWEKHVQEDQKQHYSDQVLEKHTPSEIQEKA